MILIPLIFIAFIVIVIYIATRDDGGIDSQHNRDTPYHVEPRGFEPHRRKRSDYSFFDSEQEVAGKYGEKIAEKIIKKALDPEDIILTGVKLDFINSQTNKDIHAEMDDVIINTYGVFIVEVKNYFGKLYGNEDDKYWRKDKTDDYDIDHSKEVKNPIRQAHGQAGALGIYLKQNGIYTWVEGYAYFVNHNSAVYSPRVLNDENDMRRVFHTAGRRRLTQNEVSRIRNILFDKQYE